MSMKKVLVIAISFALMAIMGVSLTVYTLNNRSEFEKTVRIEQATDDNGNFIPQTEELEMKAEGLVPGGKVEYSIDFEAPISDSYRMTMTFERSGGTQLEKYLDVEIAIDGQSGLLYSGKMNSLFEQGAVTLGDNVSTASTVYVRFLMDIELGEEVKGKTVDFISKIIVEKV